MILRSTCVVGIGYTYTVTIYGYIFELLVYPYADILLIYINVKDRLVLYYSIYHYMGAAKPHKLSHGQGVQCLCIYAYTHLGSIESILYTQEPVETDRLRNVTSCCTTYSTVQYRVRVVCSAAVK